MLHDIDFERYPEEHCFKCCELLRAHGIDKQNLILGEGGAKL